MSRRGAIGLLVAVLALAGCASSKGPDISGVPRENVEEAAKVNTQLGLDYMRKGHLDAALDKLNRALALDSDYALAHSLIALIYSHKGDVRRAEKHYREAVDLDADDPVTLNNFGVFLCDRGEFAKATELFLSAAKAKKYSTPEQAYANAGKCARRSKNLDTASQYFREALRLNANFPDALAQMASLSLEAGDFLRARAFLQRYEAVGRATPETLLVGARTERALGDAMASAMYEKRLRTEFPQSAEAEHLLKPQ